MTRMKRLLCFIALPLAFWACNQKITFPSVAENPTNAHHSGQFVWHDLATYNPEVAITFYSQVFGWNFEQLGSGNNSYYVIKNNGKRIGGVFKLNDEYGKVAEWISSVSVNNIDDAINYNLAEGGKTIFKKAYFPGRGESALVSDPQGAFVALLFSDSGDPEFKKSSDISVNEWLWNELWTNDFDRSVVYYKGLFSYKAENLPQGNRPYVLFNNGINTLSGAINNPVEDSRSSWMPYIKVTNVKKMVEKAKAAGAHVMLEPTSSIRRGTVAVLMDPTGGQFTIQEWN